jgi:endoglucanase
MHQKFFRTCAVALALAFAPSLAATPVETHGALSVVGGKVVNAAGKPVQLAGMSLFWSGWMGQFYNRKAVSTLASDWKSSVIRAAVGVEGNSNYLVAKQANLDRTDSVIQAAIDNGIYVIIDWHDHYAHRHTAQAVEFFTRMATKWGKYPNVIYEIFNEPMGDQAPSTAYPDGVAAVTWPEVEAYSDTVIEAIRAIDPSNLILVGNTYWCQNPTDGIGSFLNDKYTNLAYTLHFYAGTHGASLRNVANTAIRAGLAVFISEWGTSSADGGGGTNRKVYTTESATWLAWAKANNLSWCNWSVANKDESSAAFLPIAGAKGWWPDSVLSVSGLWVREQIRALGAAYTYPEPPPPDKPDTASVPGRVQAEGFVAMSGIQSESGADVDGTDNLGYIEPGDWADYVVNVTSEAPMYFHARVSSGATTGGTLVLKNAAGATLASIEVAPTGGWQRWVTRTDSTRTFTLPLGLNTVRLSFVGTGTRSIFNLNWVELGNSLVGTKAPLPRAKTTWNLKGRQLAVQAQGLEGSLVRIRDLDGRILTSRRMGRDGAVLSIPERGVVIAEIQGPAGRQVHKLLVN